MAKLRRFGGTPVAEGVRLEVGKYTVFAVRNADKDISVRMRREPRVLLRTLMRIPLLRGAVRMLRDIHRFFDGLSESSELEPQQVVRGTGLERSIAKLLGVHPQRIVAWIDAILLLLIAAVCMYAAPLGAEAFLLNYLDLTRAAVNGIVCAVRIFGFLLAIGFGCHLRIFRRMLMYRCAINRATNCYERHGALTLENAMEYPDCTRRSEAAFLICVMIVSMILFSWIRTDGVLLTLAARLAILLGVAAVLNEPFSALEAAELNWATRILRAPIDLIQHMTTLEPHPQVMEVALCAFRAALGEIDEEVTDN